MSYYRYALESYLENGDETLYRSLTPFTYDYVSSHDFFTYRYYTSESENAETENCYVVSMGYERRPHNRRINTVQYYDRYVLHYFISGKGTYNDLPLKAGQMLIVPPYGTRYFVSDPADPLEFYYITVSGKGSASIANDVGIGHTEEISECPFISRIPNTFYNALFEEHTERDPSLYLMGTFLQLMAMHKSYTSRSFDVPQEKGFYYYKQAIQYIEWYLLSDITPDDIARYLHISPPYLRKIFAKYGNCSVRDHLLQKRLHYAANQLSVTQCTVQAAASSIGYNDCAQFSKMFKKHIGISPGEYRKTHKPQASSIGVDKE